MTPEEKEEFEIMIAKQHWIGGLSIDELVVKHRISAARVERYVNRHTRVALWDLDWTDRYKRKK